jgi:hypothetical protein
MSIIYGMREICKDEYFYVGSTKHSLRHRLQQHKDYMRLGYNKNRHFTNKIKQVGWVNVALDILQECDLQHQFDVEREWIDLLKTSGHPLTNIKHADEFPKQFPQMEINLQHVIDFVDIHNGNILPSGDVLHDKLLHTASRIVDHLFDNHYDVFEEIASALIDETLKHETVDEKTTAICRRVSKELERHRCGA